MHRWDRARPQDSGQRCLVHGQCSVLRCRHLPWQAARPQGPGSRQETLAPRLEEREEGKETGEGCATMPVLQKQISECTATGAEGTCDFVIGEVTYPSERAVGRRRWTGEPL